MASPSSPPKNVTKRLHEPIARLLRDGGTVRSPSKDMQQAAKHLAGLGLISALHREYVWCADPRDRDFPPRNRHCRGRIYLEDGFDEAAHDLRCPECERPVFPARYRKQRYAELKVQVRRDGVIAFVEERLKDLDAAIRQPVPGVWHVAKGDDGVTVCLVDYCGESKYLTRDWAMHHPTCYIAVSRQARDSRFLAEPWLQRFCLAEVVCGLIKLPAVVGELAAAPRPATLLQTSLPVYTNGIRPIVAEPVATVQPGRIFRVAFDGDRLRIEGEDVVAPQGKSRLAIFQVLWDTFLEDLKNVRKAEEFRALSVNEIREATEQATGTHITDVETKVRRVLNRFQQDAEQTVKKKLGYPIGREDIVQTMKWRGQSGGDYGYRLNPETVAVSPIRPSHG